MLRGADDPRHAHRLLHRHLPAHPGGLAAAHPRHDVPAQERGTGLRTTARPDPPRTVRPDGARRVPPVARRLARRARARPERRPGGGGHPRRPDGPPGQGQAPHLRRRVGCAGGGPSGSAASGGSTLLPRRPRRGADLPGPGGARHLLHDRGAGPDHDRLRRRRAGRHHGPAAAAGRRDLVPGLLGARDRAATWPPLSCRADRATDDGWRVTGQKVWTSLAQYADRCVLLTRTGTRESAHRGITALFVDMDSPGIECGPSRRCTAPRSSPRSSSTTSLVPLDRTLGEEGQGWSVAMDLLPYERSTALWHRAAYLHQRLQEPARRPSPRRRSTPLAVGEVAQLLYALRARSRSTQRRLAAGEHLGPETSIDKVLVATAEQAVFDLVADGLGPSVTVGDDPASDRWRREFLYSRAATIYGGTAEIQRNIIARRLLDLGIGPVMDGEDAWRSSSGASRHAVAGRTPGRHLDARPRRARLARRAVDRPPPGRVGPLRAAGLEPTPPASALDDGGRAPPWVSRPTLRRHRPAAARSVAIRRVGSPGTHWRSAAWGRRPGRRRHRLWW